MSANLKNPWVQLIVGVICMACVANLQYGWTLFVDPDRCEVSLGACRDPGRIHRVRRDRDLAHSASRVTWWTASGRAGW